MKIYLKSIFTGRSWLTKYFSLALCSVIVVGYWMVMSKLSSYPCCSAIVFC